jgi:hypothetical protein
MVVYEELLHVRISIIDRGLRLAAIVALAPPQSLPSGSPLARAAIAPGRGRANGESALGGAGVPVGRGVFGETGGSMVSGA